MNKNLKKNQNKQHDIEFKYSIEKKPVILLPYVIEVYIAETCLGGTEYAQTLWGAKRKLKKLIKLLKNRLVS